MGRPCVAHLFGPLVVVPSYWLPGVGFLVTGKLDRPRDQSYLGIPTAPVVRRGLQIEAVSGAAGVRRRSVQASGAEVRRARSHERTGKSWMLGLSDPEHHWHLAKRFEFLRSHGYRRPVISVLSLHDSVACHK